jgi:spore coat polysaccharide biosynthesis protein SpsF
MLINIIIQARTSSKRYRSKVLINLFNDNIIIYLAEKLKKIKYINKIIVATSVENSDNKLSEVLKKKNIEVFRGSLNNVYSRYRVCTILHKCDYFIRISGDSPFLSTKLLQSFINIIKKNPDIDILTNLKKRSFPKGQSIEICNSRKFISIKNYVTKYSEKEHVTKFFYNNSERFKFLNICLKNQLRIDDLNSCIDYPRDIFFSKRFINNSKIKNLHKNLIITKS